MLHLVDRWGGRGGAYRHLEDLLVAQERAGHTLAVAAAQADAPAPARFYRVAGLDSRIATRSDLAPAVADFRPDVLHLHTVVNPAVLGWAASLPAVVTIQDHRYFCPAQGKWTRGGAVCREALSEALCADCFEDVAYFTEVLELTRARLAAVKRLRVVVLSRYMAGELAAAGVPADRIAVVPPFVAAPSETPSEAIGAGHVALVGRLTDAKGVRDTVAAWRQAGVGLPLVAAGSGPLREWLAEQGVAVTGWLERPALRAFLGHARALLLTPRWQEPFGIAGLEALIARVPVVAWRSGGVEEWHPGPLAEWGDVAGVGEALRAAVREGPVAEGVREALRRRFAPERTVRGLDRVYRLAVGLP